MNGKKAREARASWGRRAALQSAPQARRCGRVVTYPQLYGKYTPTSSFLPGTSRLRLVAAGATRQRATPANLSAIYSTRGAREARRGFQANRCALMVLQPLYHIGDVLVAHCGANGERVGPRLRPRCIPVRHVLLMILSIKSLSVDTDELPAIVRHGMDRRLQHFDACAANASQQQQRVHIKQHQGSRNSILRYTEAQ